MQRIDRILAVIDPTVEQHPGALKAARLARACDATLELFICDFDPALTGRPFFDTDALRRMRDEFLAQRTGLLQLIADELRAGGLVVETQVRWDNPLYRGILRRIEESSPDLVVKDTHYHSLLRRALVSNTDWQLIRTCPVPLLLAKASAWPQGPHLAVALDPGHAGDAPATLDHDLLDSAQWMAGKLEGDVEAVHAFLPTALLGLAPDMAGLSLVDNVTTAALIEAERRRADELVRGVAGSHGLPSGSVHIAQGAAMEVLPEFTRSHGTDLLLMGAVSRSRLREVFIGSTAERVLDRIPCDVLVVKPVDFREKLPF